MSIFSSSFVIFLLILGVLYFIVPKKIQWIVILAGNLVFYSASGYPYLIYILSCTFFTWYAALRIEQNGLDLKAALAAAE